MATRFTRVTVVANGRELDVSLPAGRPIIEVLPQLCGLLHVAPPGPAGTWSLSSIAGVIDSRGCLDDAGVVDADVLYLTMPDETPAPPFVEDVAEQVRGHLDGDASEWTGPARRLGTSAVAAIAVLGLVPVLLQVPLAPVAVVAVLAAVGLGAAGLAWALRGHGGAFVAGAAVSTWTAAGIVAMPDRVSGLVPYVFGATAGAGVGLAAFAVLGARWRAVSAAGAVVGGLGIIAAEVVALDIEPVGVAGVLVVVVLLVLGLAPQLAVGRSGLLGLMRAEEKGEAVARDDVDRAVRTGQDVLTGVVAGSAALVVLSASVVVTARQWPAVALGATLAVLVALRSRAFTRTAQVVPLLAAAVAVATVAIVAVPPWLVASGSLAGVISAGGLVVLVVLVVVAGGSVLDELAAARLRRGLDLLEAVAMVAVVPLVLAAVGAFDWVRQLAG